MNHNKIIAVGLTIVGMIIALALGGLVADGNYRNLGIAFGVVGVLTVCVFLRANVWLLIPLCSALTGSIGFLPIPAQVNEIATLMAFGTFLILYAFKAVPAYPKLNKYDLLLFINLAYLATVYARNPAGILLFKTDIIGGRPYFAIFIALLGYWVLQHVTLNPKSALLVPILSAFSSIGASLLGAVTALSPGLAYRIYGVYTGVTLPTANAPGGAEGDQRKLYLSSYGNTVGTAVVAFRSPTRLIFFLSPIFSLLFYSAIIAALLSGFRSVFATLVAMSFISEYFRNGIASVMRIGVIALVVYLGIIGFHAAGYELPLPAQRTMSFLPGPWDQRAVDDAAGSSEWRYAMWREALTNERYIRNKLLGDGFGFRASDLQGFQSMGGMAATTPEQLQDYFLVVGAYHSGPVSAIRYVGAIGLLLMTIFMISCARYGWRLIVRAKGTPYFVMSLFVCSPVIFSPIGYWLIFGAAESAFTAFPLSLGMLNLLDRSLRAFPPTRSPVQEPEGDQHS